MKKGFVYYKDILAGEITEAEDGFHFNYYNEYLNLPDAEPISLTMPFHKNPFQSDNLFPFFDGLIPEGWLLDIALKNWKLNERDRMELLLKCCKDNIGAVSVIPESNKTEL
ncbi:MAG TPA: HipA N-terminal domain-containing protein [Ignavibacteria bacterium]|nr:HipA N-terminal domain-containing protein [Ignavibacteria bacterium]